MKLRICLSAFFLLLQIYLSAQDKNENYIGGSIPDSLLKDANTVCRLSETEVEVISPAKIVTRTRNIYRIMNSNGEAHAYHYARYDKLHTVNSVNGEIYNSAGKEIKHLKKKDMADFANNGIAFVSDDRIKVMDLNYNAYPYSVVFEEEDEEAGALYIPGWYPPRSEDMSVVVSRYILTVPSSYKFRYKMINTNVEPVITQKKDKITYTWEIHNLPTVQEEPLSVTDEAYDPFMLIGPTEFALEAYSGNMSDWKSYGQFYYTLQKGRDVLPDDVKKEVHALTDAVADPLKKIAVLYDYLQKNTHYVLISFGIGGLQTYDAEYVAKNKFGDCKALSNYMIALLKEAGITGRPVIIRGDSKGALFFPDFPSHQFNHVICAVPLKKDTVWLECTDQYLPAGYLGEFTADRYGLMIDEDGGTLVHTPVYGIKDNTSIRNIFSKLDKDGNLEIKSETCYRGLSHDPVEELSHHFSKDKQMEYLKENFNLPTYTVNICKFQEDYSARIPLIRENLDISVNSYAHLTGKRIFINPDILRRSELKFPEENERKLDFQLRNEKSDIDSVIIEIPAGYTTESQPADLNLQTRFGHYRSRTEISADKIKYYRQFDHFRGRYPASDYKDVRSFYNAVYDADHDQIVLVKK